MLAPLRRAARATVLLSPALLLLAVAAPASAAQPVSWPDIDELSTLENLLLIVGAPLALFVIITLLVMAPSVAKGSSYRSLVPWYAEPMQFGTVPSSDASSDTVSDTTTGGGAGVRW